MNGELKEHANSCLRETVKTLPLNSKDKTKLSRRAWGFAVKYMSSLPDTAYRGPNQVALASLMLAADSLSWSFEKKYEIAKSTDNSMFSFSVFGEMGRTLGL